MILSVAIVGRAPRVEGAVADDVLLTRFAQGDRDALGELFDRHHRATYRFLARLTGAHAADLDDLVQSTFVEVARAASRFDGRATVRTWLFGIGLNVARHYRRGIARRRRVITETFDERPSQIPGVDRPDQAAERSELLGALDRAIVELPTPLREAFVACELEELPGADVARLLGVPVGTVFRRLHDARKALRAALKEPS